MELIKMPNGDTPMQYPFPYKNSSGDTTSGGSTNLDPTFNATTTDTLLVTGNATFQGVIDAEIIVGTFISGSNFTGQESKAGLSTTSQKNTSTNNTAYAGLEAINNNNGTVGLYSYGSSHATRPTSAWLETTNPLKVKGSTTSLFAGTNENLICSGTNVQLPFLTASRPVSTDGSFNLVSASITGTGSTVLQTSPTLITPNLGVAVGTSLQLSGLTTSQSVQTDASKNLVSVTNTGTGNNVMSVSPTLTGTTSVGTLTATGVVSGTKFRGEENVAGFSTSYQKNSNSGGSASVSVFNNADSDLSLSITGTTSSNTAAISTDRPLEIISDSSISLIGTVIADALSPSLPVSTNGSKQLVSASVTGTGSTVLQTSPTLITPTLGVASASALKVTTAQSVVGPASYIGWNDDGGSGATFFSNQRAASTGGFRWRCYNISDTLTSTPLTLSTGGDLTATGLVTGTGFSTAASTSIGSTLAYSRTAATQSIPNSTGTVINYDTLYTAQTTGVGTGFTYSAGRFTNASGGTRKIIVTAFVPFASSTSNGVIGFRTNSIVTFSRAPIPTDAGNIVTVASLANGEWIESSIFQASGGAISTLNDPSIFPWMSITLLQ